MSPRANRFILHNDAQNPLISSLENFQDSFADFDADLLVIGGLQMMDNFPFALDVRQERIAKIGQFLRRIRSERKKRKVHFEMASFTEEVLMNDIVRHVLPQADSVGMNEQELPNLLSILEYGNISLVADTYPRVATALDQMRDVYKLVNTLTHGRLTRIHLHTLPFQAILTRKGSHWKYSREASAKAALTAHRHTCGSHDIDTAKAKIIMDDSFTTTRNSNGFLKKQRIPFNTKNPVACWNEVSKIKYGDAKFVDSHEIEICVAPVLVCTRVIQTGAGGDNISAGGLVLQI